MSTSPIHTVLLFYLKTHKNARCLETHKGEDKIPYKSMKQASFECISK